MCTTIGIPIEYVSVAIMEASERKNIDKVHSIILSIPVECADVIALLVKDIHTGNAYNTNGGVDEEKGN
jgi:hypothetical protein